MTARPNGRPPKPTELKALQGNPGKRRLSDAPIAAKPPRTPPVPAALGPAGRTAWLVYWTHGAPWLSEVDVPIVHRLCKLHDVAAAIEDAIKAEGLTVVNEKTERSALHHLVDRMLGVYGRMDDMGALLGFDPVNRARIKVERPPADALREWEHSA